MNKIIKIGDYEFELIPKGMWGGYLVHNGTIDLVIRWYRSKMSSLNPIGEDLYSANFYQTRYTCDVRDLIISDSSKLDINWVGTINSKILSDSVNEYMRKEKINRVI